MRPFCSLSFLCFCPHPFLYSTRSETDFERSNGKREADGSFANYIIVKGDLQIPTPDNLTDEEAATLGIAVSTIVSFSIALDHQCNSQVRKSQNRGRGKREKEAQCV